jgi:GGDEF domain-containing protein
MVFRVGGDEFVVITVEKNREDFLKLSQQCITTFSKDCSVAVGYGFYEHVDNLVDCIEECDALMYENKKHMKEASAING